MLELAQVAKELRTGWRQRCRCCSSLWIRSAIRRRFCAVRARVQSRVPRMYGDAEARPALRRSSRSILPEAAAMSDGDYTVDHTGRNIHLRSARARCGSSLSTGGAQVLLHDIRSCWLTRSCVRHPIAAQRPAKKTAARSRGFPFMQSATGIRRRRRSSRFIFCHRLVFDLADALGGDARTRRRVRAASPDPSRAASALR